MTRNTIIGLRLGQLVLLAGLGGAPALRAQDPCEAKVTQALNEFDTARRIQLLMAALEPSACPPRGSWPIGVQLLAQTLIEDGKDSLAAVWMRWAVRLAPEMRADTVQFLPRVIQAFRTAKDFVGRTRVPVDSAVVTTWLWPTQPAGEPNGRLQVAASTPPVQLNVTGVGAVGQGSGVSVAPGSYQIAATAAGYDTARVTREVLPGVTTLMLFHLRSMAPVQVVEQPQDTTHAPAAAPHKKGLPWWVKVGAAGGIAWAIAWNAYIKSH
jgi:hypothetical protein